MIFNKFDFGFGSVALQFIQNYFLTSDGENLVTSDGDFFLVTDPL